ncbi:MAG: dipeptidase PepE [Burkholderiaceae bacterium]
MVSTGNPPPNLLLLSNSRSPNGDYLVHALPALREFAGTRRRALFFPFAAVTVDWDAYLGMAQQALDPLAITLDGAHRCTDLQSAIAQAELLLVGGGNTFRLLYEMRARLCLEPMRAAVAAGAHYVGWSAGSVLAAPSIATTNDMPIIDPLGLDALALIPFQINAHYSNALPTGHQGETRDQRLAEYLVLHPGATILALPEGNWLEVRGQQMQLSGPHSSLLFVAGQEPANCAAGRFQLPSGR